MWAEFFSALFKILVENLAAVIVSFVGLIAGIVTTYATYRSYHLQKSTAEREPKLDLFLISSEVCPDVYFLLPLADRLVIEVPFNIVVRNSGNISAEKVEVMIEIPEACYFSAMPREMSSIARARRMKHAIDTKSGTEIAQVWHGIGEVAPGVSICLEERVLFSEESIFVGTTEAEFKDGTGTVKWRASYSFKIRAMLSYRNGAPKNISYQFHVRRSQEDDIEAFVQSENNLAHSPDGPRKKVTVCTFARFQDKSSLEENSTRRTQMADIGSMRMHNAFVAKTRGDRQ
jgi:hypothetical protein